MEILQYHQLNIMLVLSGICGMTAFFVHLSNSTPKRRKKILIAIELTSMFLLLMDRGAYMYRGLPGSFGYYMVRITNFSVFFLTLALIWFFNLYLKDLYLNEGGLKSVPKRLKFNDYIIGAGVILLIISQFTSFYYTFDASNRYERGPGFIICYSIPLIVLLIQFSFMISYRGHLPRKIEAAIIIFVLAPLVAAIAQVFLYGLSLVNIAAVGTTLLVYVVDLVETNNKVDKATRLELEYLKKAQQGSKRLFDQTATALVSAIDAKDEDTRGHSSGVAEIARSLAELSGKNEKECEEIYYAGLLHDVGKIGIPESIISKNGKLTDEEYETVRGHSVKGSQILSGITDYPYLSVAARYHHERYDGKGYPEGLKGEEIPEIARIIAVADAYEVMTSKKTYRDPTPREKVKEELLRGSGGQFDPHFAQLMMHIIDLDSGKESKKREDLSSLSESRKLHPKEYRSEISEGIRISDNPVVVKLKNEQDKDFEAYACVPAIILFDSLDARVHDIEKDIKNQNYLEYGEIWLDGHIVSTAARNMLTDAKEMKEGDAGDGIYVIEASKYRDHVRIKTRGNGTESDTIVALTDSTRFAYMAVTGEHSLITVMDISKKEEKTLEEDIPRIAKEVSYINRLEGDLPNIQIDGYRTAATMGVPVHDGMQLIFHTMSLPSAWTMWHCPLIVLFYSRDKMVYGEGYREYALISLDGEKRDAEGPAENEFFIERSEDFTGWDLWKEINKKGYESTVTLRRRGRTVTVLTENLGIKVKNITMVNDDPPEIYVALTGDLCALTDIRIRNG